MSCSSAVLLVIRAGGRRHRFQRHAALGAIAGMILLHFRVHRAGVDGFALRLLLLFFSSCFVVAGVDRNFFWQWSLQK
jgi:hypothetical protein